MYAEVDYPVLFFDSEGPGSAHPASRSSEFDEDVPMEAVPAHWDLLHVCISIHLDVSISG